MAQLRTCNSGGTVIFTALALPLIVITMAVVVDLGRLYAIKSKAQNASDAALLGGVATISKTPLNQEVIRLFNLNYPNNYMGSTVSDINTTQVRPGVFEARYTVITPTTVLGFLSEDIMTLEMLSQVTRGFDRNLNRRLEVTMVLDNTGSMAGSKIESLRTASIELTNIIFGSSETLNNLRVSVVPYDIVVNVGTNREDWIQTESINKYNSMVAAWGKGIAYNRFTDFFCGPYQAFTCIPDRFTTCTPGCNDNCNIETGQCTQTCFNCEGFVPTFIPGRCENITTENCSPNGANDRIDVPPSSDPLTKFRLPYENRLVEDGNNIYNAWARNLAPILFSSNSKSEVIASLNSMQVSGATRINVGLMWGWFTLSPRWQGVWDSGKPNMPQDPAENLQKAIVLMTDGKNVFPVDNANVEGLCGDIKEAGITIYTIGFGEGVNTNLLRNCATNPQFYWFAPTEEDLRTAFQTIADDLLFNTLRLSQ